MAITPVQPNIDNTKLPYREAKGTIKTDKDIKPLPPQGHLVHDTLLSVPQYFLKDIAYDIKAVKDGFQGKANDHQLGRLNDVGLKVGGIGIATYLANQYPNSEYTVSIDDVFGYDEVPYQNYRCLYNYIFENYSYDDIMKLLNSDLEMIKSIKANVINEEKKVR